MAENTQIELLQNEIKRLETSVKAAVDKNADYERQLKDLDSKQVAARVSALEADIKTRDDKVAALAAQVKTEQDARTAAEAAVADANKKLAAVQAELSTIKTTEAKRARVAQWVERTGVEEAVATKAVDKLAKLGDDEFKEFLETQPAKAAATPPAKSGADNADTKVLDSAKPEPKDAAALASAGVNKDVEATRAELSKYMAQNFLGKKKQAKKEGE